MYSIMNLFRHYIVQAFFSTLLIVTLTTQGVHADSLKDIGTEGMNWLRKKLESTGIPGAGKAPDVVMETWDKLVNYESAEKNLTAEERKKIVDWARGRPKQHIASDTMTYPFIRAKETRGTWFVGYDTITPPEGSTENCTFFEINLLLKLNNNKEVAGPLTLKGAVGENKVCK